MKIFVLEDDSNCNGVIEWLRDSAANIKIVKNLEDASYYLEYEDDYRSYDKFLWDASLPAASIYHLDGEEKEYNGSYNGIDYIMDCFGHLGIDIQKVAILTAHAPQVRDYFGIQYAHCSIKIIDKNDSDLTRQLQNFLYL